MFNFQETVQVFSKVAASFPFPPAACDGPPSPHSQPPWHCLFEQHQLVCVKCYLVVCICISQIAKDIEHLLICLQTNHILVFFGKISIQVFYWFKKLCCFFVLSWGSSLANFFHWILDLQVFFASKWLFIFLMVFFDAKKFLIWMKCNLLIFSVLCFCCSVLELFPEPKCTMIFSYVFLLRFYFSFYI